MYPAILEPQAVADLLGFVAFQFDARSAEEGRSPLSAPGGKTKVGEKIFDERLNIYSDPWHPDLPGSQSAQGGIPAQKIYLVRNGVVENLIYSRFWAKQKGKEPTPGPVNSIMESTQSPVSLEDMIKSMDRGLLLGRFWYIRGLGSPNSDQHGSYARRHLVHRERQDSISRQELPLQSKRHATSGSGQYRNDRQAGASWQL